MKTTNEKLAAAMLMDAVYSARTNTIEYPKHEALANQTVLDADTLLPISRDEWFIRWDRSSRCYPRLSNPVR